MATSLGTDGDILQHIQAHMPLSNAIHGEEAMEGNAAVETPPVICFSGTIKETADGAETPEEDTRRNVGNDRQP
jgi:hypothetical protein